MLRKFLARFRKPRPRVKIHLQCKGVTINV